MAEYVIDLSGVEVKTIKEIHGIEAIEALWGLPVREEIVRCRDCKYRRRSWNWHHPNFVDHFFCAYTGGHEVKPDGFCAWGKRKEVDA